jgi:arylsulfatase A-like enzyme
LILVAAAAAVLLWPRDGVRPGHTNLVVVVVDTLRADRLGCYGYQRPTSPNIDRLAADGVLFEIVVANSSWTRPSMASMLSGRFPRRTGVFKERFDVLSPEVMTLAELFAARGYTTCGVTANPTVNAVFGFDRGFDTYVESDVVWDWMESPEGAAPDRTELANAAEITDIALKLLEDTCTPPFYLQLLYIDPHSPYRPPTDFDHPLNRNAETDSDWYDAEVAFTDREVGRLLDRVLSLYPDTMVVLTSDHGEGLDDHPGVPLSDTHGYTLYDSVLLVPLIVRHPELASGLRYGGMVQLLDLFPTIAELFDLPLGDGVSGSSLAPILRGGASSGLPTRVFSETSFRSMDKICVREGGLKLIVNNDHLQWREGLRPDLEGPGAPRRAARAIEMAGPRELYRVPGREHPRRWRVNRVNDRQSVSRLSSAIADFEASVPPRSPVGRDGSIEVGETERRQLEALGYLVDEEK